MTDKEKATPTYEDEVLRILAFEFRSTDREESERKIKRRLRDKKLGEYDQARIDFLREVKQHICHEVSYPKKSKYFTPQGGKYSDIKDFNTDLMARDLASMFPEVPKPVIESFVPYAVYLYYLR